MSEIKGFNTNSILKLSLSFLVKDAIPFQTNIENNSIVFRNQLCWWISRTNNNKLNKISHQKYIIQEGRNIWRKFTKELKYEYAFGQRDFLFSKLLRYQGKSHSLAKILVTKYIEKDDGANYPPIDFKDLVFMQRPCKQINSIKLDISQKSWEPSQILRPLARLFKKLNLKQIQIKFCQDKIEIGNNFQEFFKTLKAQKNLQDFHFFLMETDEEGSYASYSKLLSGRESNMLNTSLKVFKKLETLKLNFRLEKTEYFPQLVQTISGIPTLKHLRIKFTHQELESDVIKLVIRNLSKLINLKTLVFIAPECSDYNSCHSILFGNLISKLKSLEVFGLCLDRSKNYDINPLFDEIISKMRPNMKYWIQYRDIENHMMLIKYYF